MHTPVKFLTFVILCSLLNACGSSDKEDFTGTWNGALTLESNGCPFTVNQSAGPLFPMVVTEDANGVFTVTAANGDVATGGQGEGEVISFTANAQKFGDIGTMAPYTCTLAAPGYTVGYLTEGDNQSSVTLHVTFNNCTAPNTNSTSSCSVLYSGEATR